MSKAVITEGLLDDIADAIIAKGGASAALTPAQMASAIGQIPSGGGASVSTGTFTTTTTTEIAQISVSFIPDLIVVYCKPSNETTYQGFRYMIIRKDEIAVNIYDSTTTSSGTSTYQHSDAVSGYNSGHISRECYAELSGNVLTIHCSNGASNSMFVAGQSNTYIIVGGLSS